MVMHEAQISYDVIADMRARQLKNDIDVFI